MGHGAQYDPSRDCVESPTVADETAADALLPERELRALPNRRALLGNSPALQSVLSTIRVVAPTDATVLIWGETGTGKELLAQAVHDLSSRNSGAFITVNCAAIPATLLESELFGHEKGAFTGAVARRIGKFEQANRGTLFLDEVGEISIDLQSKLLRAIQEREFERLGSANTVKVDVRFVAATNRDLGLMVRGGQFRNDLYYRLNVFPISVPPLRARSEDIPLLAEHFAEVYSSRFGRRVETIARSTLDALCAYAWPGNIRELQNVIERAVILSDGPELYLPPEELANLERPCLTSRSSCDLALRKEDILRALEAARGRVSGPDGAAAKLGLKRTTLQSRMRRLNIVRSFH